MRQSSSKKKTNDQRIIPPLDPRALVHLICILTQFENTLFQTFKPGVATLVNSNGTEKKKKKKKVREKQKMVEKLGQIECCIFTLTMLPSKVLRKKVRFTIGARASNSAAGQKFMLKGLSLSLSLLYCKLQPVMYKRMAALVSYRLLEFLSHRCYSRPTNLPDS